MSVPDEGYYRNASCALNLIRFNYDHWVDTSADGILVSEGDTRTVISRYLFEAAHNHFIVFNLTQPGTGSHDLPHMKRVL